jgi:hypothetical protein
MRMSRFASCVIGALAISFIMVVPLGAQENETKDPAAPTDLWAAQTSKDAITLVWKPTPGATSQTVYVSKGGVIKAIGTVVGNVARYIISVQTLTRLFGGGPLGSVLEFFVDAADSKGAVSPKARSNTVAFTDKDVIPSALGAPTGLQASPSGEGQITLTWNPVPDATGYAIGRAVGGEGFKTLCAICPTDARFVDTAVMPGVRHVYTVEAITPGGNTKRATSNPVPKDAPATSSGGEATLPPKGPTNLKASLKDGTVTLTWSGHAASGVAYRILRAIGQEVAGIVAELPPGSTRFVDRPPTGFGGFLRYAIVAINPKGSAPPAYFAPIDPAKAAADEAAPPKGPTNPKATLKDGRVTVTWGAGTAVSGVVYQILRSIGGARFQTVAEVRAAVGRWLDPQPNLAKTAVRYQIVAKNAKGASAPVSVPVTETPKGASQFEAMANW